MGYVKYKFILEISLHFYDSRMNFACNRCYVAVDTGSL